MTEQQKERLKQEIAHIFDGGANEIRIFDMCVNFINNQQSELNKLPIDGVMVCTFRYYDEDFPENTRFVIKAKSSDEAFSIALKEFGDIAYDVMCEEIEYKL